MAWRLLRSLGGFVFGGGDGGGQTRPYSLSSDTRQATNLTTKFGFLCRSDVRECPSKEEDEKGSFRGEDQEKDEGGGRETRLISNKKMEARRSTWRALGMRFPLPAYLSLSVSSLSPRLGAVQTPPPSY